MILYFDNNLKLKTIIPHGEIPRQCGDLNNFWVLLPSDFNTDNKTIGVRFKRPGDLKYDSDILLDRQARPYIFEKIDENENAGELEVGRSYKKFYIDSIDNDYFWITEKAGNLQAQFTLYEGVSPVSLSTIKQFGNATIYLEETLGLQPDRSLGMTRSEYESLLARINQITSGIKNGNRLDSFKDVEDELDAQAHDFQNHVGNTNNPHHVTKAQIGLGNADNTSDMQKPVSIAQQQALDGKVPITRKVNGHALNQDINLDKNDIGLGNVDNTPDLQKPISNPAKEWVMENAGKINEIEIGGVKQPIVDKVVKMPAYPTKESLGITNVDNTSDLEKPISNATQQALNLINQALDLINGKIPNQASANNQLADKEFVNSSIATNTAVFKGTYDDIANLPLTNVDANDYAFVVTTDNNGNTAYNRYKFVEGTGWVFEYTLNNSSFTAAQWAAINSGMTLALKNQITANQQAIAGIKNGEEINSFQEAELKIASKQDKIIQILLTGESGTITEQQRHDLIYETDRVQLGYSNSQGTIWLMRLTHVIIPTAIGNGDEQYIFEASYGLPYNYQVGEINVVLSVNLADSSWMALQEQGISENFVNKVAEITTDSTDIEYPSAKAVYKFVDNAKKIAYFYLYKDSWSLKQWNGTASIIVASNIWTDGKNIYYSTGTENANFVLDKATSTWSRKEWDGLTTFTGRAIWTDGENIYYSASSEQHVLAKDKDYWTTQFWDGLPDFLTIDGEKIWKDGENIYYSQGSYQYVLGNDRNTWTAKTWNGLTNFNGDKIWTDGENFYYSNDSSQYVLNKATSTWTVKTWTGLTSFNASDIWTDGKNIYYSNGSTQYVLNKATSTWIVKTWTGLTSFNASDIWTDGDDFYRSQGNTTYVLGKQIVDVKYLYENRPDITDDDINEIYNESCDEFQTEVAVNGDNITITSDTVDVTGDNIKFTSESTYAIGDDIYL